MKIIPPCPFCGCTKSEMGADFKKWWVICCECKVSSGIFCTYDEAVNAWCRRPTNQEVEPKQADTEVEEVWGFEEDDTPIVGDF